MFDLDELYVLPLDKWISAAVKWASIHLHPLFNALKWPVVQVLSGVDFLFQAIPFPLFVLLFALIAWRLAGRGVALFSAASLVFIAFLGVWPEAMTTLALIVTAIILCIIVGIPIGILCARSDLAWRITRPILDVMQTTPTFVYLVPVVMLFGVGNVPGGVAVIVAAIPPLIRFTNIGIRQVQEEMVEAGIAFGATSRQLLWEVQLPLALPTILGGLNQTVLTAMVMAVTAAMIGAEGLGLVVLQGLGRLDVGRAAVGGISIVLLAILLDRITQAVAEPGRPRGPGMVAAFRRLFLPGNRDAEAPDRADPLEAQ